MKESYCLCWLQDAKSSKGIHQKEEVDYGDLSDDSGSEQSSIGEDAIYEGSRSTPSVPLVAQYPSVSPQRQQRAAQHREGQRVPPRLPKEEAGARQRVQQPVTVSGGGGSREWLKGALEHWPCKQ